MSATPGQPLTTRFGGWLSNIHFFDASLFGLSTPEALLMDPQQRLLLEATHEALAYAATATAHSSSITTTHSSQALSTFQTAASVLGMGAAVGVGIASAEYSNWVVRRYGSAPSAYSATGGALSVAAGRLSYTYGFEGPSLSVDTACSSSLVAAHTVMTHLVSSYCRGGSRNSSGGGGIVAGVGLLLSPEPTSMFQSAGMLARDGRCKTLDASADGYVRAEALGVMLLRTTATESSHGGVALAFLRATAVNQDGRSSTLTAPKGPAQEAVIAQALMAGGLMVGLWTQ